MITVVFASAPLTSQGSIDRAFAESYVILEAKVISKIEIWTLGGKLTTEDEARRIEKAIVDFQDSVQYDLSKEEAVNRRAEWLKTDIGKKSQLPITCLLLATMSPTKVLKGEVKLNQSIIHVTWTSGILQTCSDVGVDTVKGAKVVLFIKNPHYVKKSVISVGHNQDLLIGSLSIKATKKHKR